MRNDDHLWLANLARGFLALIAGCGVLILPDMARSLLLLPLSIAISVLILAVYGVLDSACIFVASFMADARVSRTALRIQSVAGMSLGLVLASLAYERARLEWFLLLIALQAFATSAAEVILARHAAQRRLALWDYTGALIAALFGIAYLVLRFAFAEQLSAGEISWLIYGYLLAFGLAVCAMSARMLYADARIPVVLHAADVRKGA